MNTAIGDPYYGHMMITSTKNCKLRPLPIDISKDSMYNTHNSYCKKILLKKLDAVLPEILPPNTKIKILPKMVLTPFIATEKKQDKIPLALKSKTPAPIRKEVWETYIGNLMKTKCPVCNNTEIDTFQFECGHVVSKNDGGGYEIANLRPICAICNKSMQTHNMIEWVKQYYPNAPILKTFKL